MKKTRWLFAGVAALGAVFTVYHYRSQLMAKLANLGASKKVGIETAATHAVNQNLTPALVKSIYGE